MPFQLRDLRNAAPPSWGKRLMEGIDQGGHVPSLVAKIARALAVPSFADKWLRGGYKGRASIPARDYMETAGADLMGAGMAASPGVGMVAQRYKNLRNPGAFLFRRLGDPEEVSNLEKLMSWGQKTMAPSTAITPTVRAVFRGHQDPYGLVFSVKKPGNIKWASGIDIGSVPDKDWVLQPGFERARKRISQIMDSVGLDRLGQYGRAVRKLEDVAKQRGERAETRWWDPPSAVWGTGLEDNPTLIDLANEPLRDLFRTQRDRLLEHGATKQHHLINEVGYMAGDPAELAGVRLSTTSPDPDLEEALRGFAQKQGLPVWRFSPQTTTEEVLRGIDRLLRNPRGARWKKQNGVVRPLLGGE